MIPIQYALRRRMMRASGQREIQWWWHDESISHASDIDPSLIGHYPFYALSGMTWAEWCNSSYNPTPFKGGWATIYVGEFADGTPDVVCIGNENYAITNNPNPNDPLIYVLGSDVIIPDYLYGVYWD